VLPLEDMAERGWLAAYRQDFEQILAERRTTRLAKRLVDRGVDMDQARG